MRAKLNERHAAMVVGLGYGDCGKGTMVDFLSRQLAAHTVVRFNGGPQAAHNVVTPDGRHHTFAQFGAGSFVPGVRTLLSRFVLIEPYALFNEAAHLARAGVPDALARLVVDRRCPVITPYHQAANRLRELARGKGAHGTCGMGVGETMSDLVDDPSTGLYAGDLSNRSRVIRVLRQTRDRKLGQFRDAIAAYRNHPDGARIIATLHDESWIEAALDVYAATVSRATIVDDAGVRAIVNDDGGAVVFEGAQGVLLDEWAGFHPYTTWSTTTFANAETVLAEAGFDGRQTRVGVLRTYATRHGPGPFPTEWTSFRANVPEPHNGDGGAQGHFRVGTFDAVASRYALAVTGDVDVLALTHIDRLTTLPPAMCTAYTADSPVDADLFVERAGEIIDIKLGSPRDLIRQERLTTALMRCKPIETERPLMACGDFVQRVERELNCTVALLSSGPTANEKRLLRSYFEATAKNSAVTASLTGMTAGENRLEHGHA